MAVNTVPAANVYPGAGGPTLGNMYQVMPNVNAEEYSINPNDMHVQEALQIGGQASPLMGLVVFVLMIVALTYIFGRYGGEGAFSNIKGSAYNVLLISLVAVAGIPVWKYAFTRIKVPGVSTWVLSS